jgi:hypothetical protein
VILDTILSSIFLVLVGDGEFAACGGLVLVANSIGNSLVLGLLSGVLVALVASTEELLLHEIDGCKGC